MKIVYILHAPFEPPGALESWAEKKGFSQSYCSPYNGEPTPPCDSFDLLIAMGGPQSPLALDKAPYLREEIALIQAAIKARIPVLGFCLGAQLIGEALGAPTEHSPNKEVGVFPIELTEAGKRDPILAGLPQKFLITHWHNDMPGLTEDAQVLAQSAGCPRQIVRYTPRTYGFQCHPEITRLTAESLALHCPDDFAPGRYVQPLQTLLASNFAAINAHMAQILENFLAILDQDPLPATKNHE